MFKKIMLWFLCKIDQSIYSPSRPDKACLHCGKYHGENVNIFKRHTSPMHLMAESTIGSEPLQIEKSPTKRSSEIEITEIKKELLEKGNKTSFYKIMYRANGNLLYQNMHLNNELPDDILKQELARIAKRHLVATQADNKN